MDLLIGLDVGTSAIKGALITSEGKLLARAKREVSLLHPREGFIEIEPDGHYRSVCSLLRELASRSKGDTVAALSMAFASGNTLLLGPDSRPLTNIISWLDRRAVGRMPELLPGLDAPAVHRVVGWPMVDMFPMAHLAWLKHEEPAVYGAAARFVMNNDWLFWLLTGKWGMDPSTATTFYLMEQESRRWHRPYLERLGIDESRLSPLMPSGSVLGNLSAEAAGATGLSTATRLVLGSFDHPSAARGTGILSPGDLLISCGTSWVGFYPSPGRELLLAQSMLVDPFLTPAGPWAGMFALTAVGVSVEWFIDNLIVRTEEERADRYGTFNRAALGCARGADGLFVNPFMDTASLAGRASALASANSRAALARAVMEGIAFEMKRRIDSLAAAGLAARRISMVGGPSESPVWPGILAEVTGLELHLVNGQTAGAVGAAVLAGIGAGVFRNEGEAALRVCGDDLSIRPSEKAVRQYASLYDRYREAVG